MKMGTFPTQRQRVALRQLHIKHQQRLAVRSQQGEQASALLLQKAAVNLQGLSHGKIECFRW